MVVEVVAGHQIVEPLEVQVEEQDLIKVVKVVQEIHLPQLLLRDFLVETELQVQLARLMKVVEVEVLQQQEIQEIQVMEVEVLEQQQ